MSESEAINLFNNQMTGRRQGVNEGLTDFSTGLEQRRQGIQEALLNRQTPLNEMNAFRSGAQTAMPQFQAFGQQGNVAGPDYSGATNALSDYNIAGYNADVMGRNNFMSGLFNLGTGYLTGRK